MRTKILMVCLGNICRSPLAQGVLENKLPQGSFIVDSAGTASYHIGKQPDKRSIEVAKKNGINITNQQARQLNKEDLENFDIVYAMDTSNYNDILALCNSEAQKSKVHLILNESDSNSNNSVPDPYYGGIEGFNNVFKMLDNACECIAKKLTSTNI